VPQGVGNRRHVTVVSATATAHHGQMLESGDMPVDAIANEVGYEDAGFFSRLFRRKVGLTPVQYRRRFGDLRRSLTSRGH